MKKKNYEYKVSVIVPVYNAEKYIEECIESLINQSINFNDIEVIMIDDGSTDNSLSICKEYKNKYKNIQLIEQENSGVSVARNKGIKAAQGKYIMMLDSDDYLSNNTILDLWNFFEEHNEEVDLVCYQLILDDGIKRKLDSRYLLYNKGTNVYDLEEYFFVYQKTVNIIIKNKFEQNLFYNEKMILSEDQDLNTRILMQKRKIGYVETAKYFYRRVGTGVSSLKNNPFYCFEDITNYNEKLLNDYKENGKIPKYIQNLVITTYTWRLTSDQIFPYAYEINQFKIAKERIFNIFKQIETEVIAKLNTNLYNKIYFLKNGNKKFNIIKDNNILLLACDNIVLYKNDCISGRVYRFKQKNNKIYLSFTLMTPFLKINNNNNNELKIYLKSTDKNNNIIYKQINEFLQKSNINKLSSDDENNNIYNINILLEENLDYKYEFIVQYENIKFPVKFDYTKFTYKNVYSKDNIISIENYKNKSIIYINKLKKLKKYKNLIKEDVFYLKNNKKAFIYRLINHIYPHKKNIHLYMDRNDVIDNAYYQFKNDFKKKDGITRYYVSDTRKKELFSKEELRHIIKPYSFKHKMYFLKCKKIFTSFIDLQIYCPFNNGIKYYRDIKRYDLVYLQHGILHAHLLNMYTKEQTEIDKFVISSKFEYNNLIKNYNYDKDDLVEALMPRMNNKINVNGGYSNKILYAPSWRAYLIGKSIKGNRSINNDAFIKSKFFTEINKVLKNKKFNDFLKKNDLRLDIKMHPIMKEYNSNFYQNDRIQIINDEIKLEDYKIFITDFSSYQFDYIKLLRPIIYFLPDYEEILSGLHSYRKLDLSYEDAFGKLCKNESEFIEELNRLNNINYKLDQKTEQKMKNFFNNCIDQCEIIYKEANYEK